jgi:hypothetical protein
MKADGLDLARVAWPARSDAGPSPNFRTAPMPLPNSPTLSPSSATPNNPSATAATSDNSRPSLSRSVSNSPSRGTAAVLPLRRPRARTPREDRKRRGRGKRPRRPRRLNRTGIPSLPPAAAGKRTATAVAPQRRTKLRSRASSVTRPSSRARPRTV